MGTGPNARAHAALRIIPVVNPDSDMGSGCRLRCTRPPRPWVPVWMRRLLRRAGPGANHIAGQQLGCRIEWGAGRPRPAHARGPSTRLGSPRGLQAHRRASGSLPPCRCVTSRITACCKARIHGPATPARTPMTTSCKQIARGLRITRAYYKGLKSYQCPSRRSPAGRVGGVVADASWALGPPWRPKALPSTKRPVARRFGFRGRWSRHFRPHARQASDV